MLPLPRIAHHGGTCIEGVAGPSGQCPERCRLFVGARSVYELSIGSRTKTGISRSVFSWYSA